jgi:hypothetical protein
MLRYEIITDFNGIVLFEPNKLVRFFGGHIDEGSDLFTRFTSSDDGGKVVEQGIVIPILAIDDAGYGIEFCIDENGRRPPEQILFENGDFPLHVEERLVLADLAVLKEWIEGLDWTFVDVPPGNYKVTIRGFRQTNELGHVTDCGYELVLKSTAALPEFTGSLEINSRVLIPLTKDPAE